MHVSSTYRPQNQLLPQGNLSAATSYTFSAKEKDAETGYSYFGSRYYSSDLSIWLSVDPMAAKYPSLSPYVYCANNPVKLVDPNGEDVWIVVYGAGYLNSQSRGQDHDVGSGFKKNAEAYSEQIKSNPNFNPDKDEVVLVEAKSMKQFADAINKEYSKGKIAELTVFSHGYSDGVSLGRQTSAEVGPEQSNAQLTNYDLRELNENTMSQLNTDNFTNTAVVNFYGCNIGGQKEDYAYDSFAQKFADYLGQDRIVNAFTGPAQFTKSNGKITYNGRMIRSADMSSQLTKFTKFRPNQSPVFP